MTTQHTTTTTTVFRVELVSATSDGNWASQCQGVYPTREAAQAAIAADETAQPDGFGGSCEVEIVAESASGHGISVYESDGSDGYSAGSWGGRSCVVNWRTAPPRQVSMAAIQDLIRLLGGPVAGLTEPPVDPPPRTGSPDGALAVGDTEHEQRKSEIKLRTQKRISSQAPMGPQRPRTVRDDQDRCQQTTAERPDQGVRVRDRRQALEVVRSDALTPAHATETTSP